MNNFKAVIPTYKNGKLYYYIFQYACHSLLQPHAQTFKQLLKLFTQPFNVISMQENINSKYYKIN